MADEAARRPAVVVKVLVITNLYPPHALGGYELSCQDVVRRWRDKGHQVAVLTTATRLPGVANDPTETEVHRDLEWYWADHELQRPAPRERLHIERANRRRLTELLDTTQPDVVSLWAMGGMSLSLVSLCVTRGQATALVIEDDWLTYAPNIDAWTSAWAKRQGLATIGAALTGVPTQAPTLPAAVPVAFASDYLRQRALATGKIDFVTSEVVPLGIDPADFPLQAPQSRQWRGRLVCVGRIEPRKGFDTAVRALTDLPGVTLRLVGPSNGHLADLMTLAAELGVADRVSSTGALARHELAEVYRDADVVVFPSRWDEPFGLVPLEAMSQATPVIATRRGGSAEFLRDGGNCLEMTADDPASIVAAVRQLAASEELRNRLVSAGLATAAAYDVDSFADGLERLHLRAAGATT